MDYARLSASSIKEILSLGLNLPKYCTTGIACHSNKHVMCQRVLEHTMFHKPVFSWNIIVNCCWPIKSTQNRTTQHIEWDNYIICLILYKQIKADNEYLWTTFILADLFRKLQEIQNAKMQLSNLDFNTWRMCKTPSIIAIQHVLIG